MNIKIYKNLQKFTKIYTSVCFEYGARAGYCAPDLQTNGNPATIF